MVAQPLPPSTETPPAAEPDLAVRKPFVTAGQKIHKWSTYLGIDWAFNAFCGVTVEYLGNHSEFGREKWNKPINQGFRKLAGFFTQDEAAIKASAKHGNTFVNIIVGGMFTLPPLMILESKKVRRSFAKFYDKLIYGKEKVENDPRFREAYDHADNEPKKDFWTGMAARFTALAPLLTLVLVERTKKVLDNTLFGAIQYASRGIGEAAGFGQHSFKNKTEDEQKARWDTIHDAFAMDFGFGLPYALMHKFFYDLFSKMKQNKHDAREERKAAQQPALAPVVGIEREENARQPRTPHSVREAARRDAALPSEIKQY